MLLTISVFIKPTNTVQNKWVIIKDEEKIYPSEKSGVVTAKITFTLPTNSFGREDL